MRDSVEAFDPHAEGALARFDGLFVDRFGPDSALVRALSDLWTIATARLLLNHERRLAGEDDLDPDYEKLILYSDDDAVSVLRTLAREAEALRMALFQEPFDFAPPGTIESSFDSRFGAGSFAAWLAAFELREFARCRQLARRPREAPPIVRAGSDNSVDPRPARLQRPGDG